MTDLKMVMAKLDEIYTKTGMDWILEVHHILTESVCPSVNIRPEDLHTARYRIDCDSIEQGITEAVERVHREVILGELVEPMAPYTNHDDAKLSEYLAAWKLGERPE